MLENTSAYSGFAVDDFDKARQFYGETLGLKVTVLDEENGLMQLDLAGGKRPTLVYGKPDLQPGNYTILNFQVDDVERAVDELSARGVEFERYDGFEQDEKGIARGMGPNIAWFKDPAGNILSVVDEGPGD
jgi:catechol 2,3-dioxygenase-like lactoylglutathione lyase family enzyme